MIEDRALLRSALGRVRLRRHSDRPPDLVRVPPVEPSVFITQDPVKEAVKRSLQAAGWTVLVRWGGERGIDIEATRGDERLVLKAKGETAPGPQQVGYYLGA